MSMLKKLSRLMLRLFLVFIIGAVLFTTTYAYSAETTSKGGYERQHQRELAKHRRWRHHRHWRHYHHRRHHTVFRLKIG